MNELKVVYPKNEDRVNFMRGLVRVSRADSVITVEEESFFINAAKGLEISESDISSLQIALSNPSQDLPVCMPFKQQSLFLIREALQLCYVDGHFSDTERLEVEKLGVELGIDTQEIDCMESWVLEGMDWVKRGEEMLQELGGN